MANKNLVNPGSFYAKGAYRDDTQPLYHSGLTFDELRAKASGWHFTKEMLSDEERVMLAVIEDLIDIVDSPPAPF